MNAPSTIESEQSRNTYIYIFFIALVLLDQFTREWLYSHWSYARGTWEIGKI